MPYCPNCGAETEADAAFCGSCGTPLEEEAPPPPPRPPARAGFPWALLGALVVLAALVAGGVVAYNVLTGDEGEEERRAGTEGEERIEAALSPTVEASPEPSSAVKPKATPKPTPEETPYSEPTATAVPPPSGHASPEEAIADWVAPTEYAGDCSTTTVEEDVGKVCSSFYGGSDSQLVYAVGLTFSEFGQWLLLEQQDDGTWLVVDSAPVTEEVMEPPWPVEPEPPAAGYPAPEDAIAAFLQKYDLKYMGDCGYADPETHVGFYCSILWEDRGDQLIYAAGPAFSEPDTWLLVAMQGEDGGWLVVDAAEFPPLPEEPVPPWP